MAKRKSVTASKAGRFRTAITQVRALKDASSGVVWRRLHRVESELVTASGQKRAMPSHARLAKMKGPKPKPKKSA